MIDFPTISKEDEEYFYELVMTSPDEDELLPIIQEGLWYQMLLASKTTWLTREEKELLLDKEHVDWAQLSANFLMYVAINHVTTDGNSRNRSQKLTTTKLLLLDSFQQAYDPESLGGDMNITSRWSALLAIAIDFMRLVEEGLLQDHTKKLPEMIADILKEQWAPLNDENVNTIYCIAGALLKTIDNLARRRKSDMSFGLKQLTIAASTTKQTANDCNLPSRRVEDKEAVALTCANSTFYNMLLKIESVYSNLLKEKNFALFGVGIVGDI